MTKAERTKQFIIETAAPLFNEKGIAGTSIDDVLQATKVAKGCLYSHFESKEMLSFAMVDYLLQKMADRTSQAIAKEATAKGKLYAILKIYENPMDPVVNGGCPIVNFGTECDDTCPVIGQKIKKSVEDSIQLLSGIVKQGIKAKEFDKGFKADEFGLKMFTLLEGGMLVGRILKSNVQMHALIGMLKKEIESNELK